jgi:hypothetical protein
LRLQPGHVAAEVGGVLARRSQKSERAYSVFQHGVMACCSDVDSETAFWTMK